MKARFPLAPAWPACLLLAACASPEGYPDLQVRDAERVTGSFDPPAGSDYVPAAVAPATIAQLEELVEAAQAAHGNFETSAAAVRPIVSAARNAGVGSENWARAQAAIADLEGIRSTVMIALADLDRIYVDAAVEGDAIARIEQARGQVDALAESENRVIGEYLDTLGS